MIITSKDNLTVKNIVALKDKKGRDCFGQYLLEGYRCVRDSLDFLLSPMLIFSSTNSEKYLNEFQGVNYIVCADDVFSKIADTQSSQGIACVAKIPKSIIDYDCKYALFLDRVRDPGNLGTIIRSALAVGFENIYCYDCVDAYNPKVVRSAMSALSRVKIFNVDYDAVGLLKENGYCFICADMNGKNIFNTNLNFNKICLAVGNEANGLSDKLLSLSEEVLCLPMRGVESLNVAVSASVLMYKLRFN